MVQTLDRVEARPLTLKETAERAGIPIVVRPWWGSARQPPWPVRRIREDFREAVDLRPGYWSCPGGYSYSQVKGPEVQKGVVVFWEGPCRRRYGHRVHKHRQTVEVLDVGAQAILVQVGQSGLASPFLIGMDDGHPFVTPVPRRCATVDAAFYWLVPKMILVEQVAGAEVKRQGDWFFIPYKREVRETQARPWHRLPTRRRIWSLTQQAYRDGDGGGAMAALRVALEQRLQINVVYSNAPLVYGWGEPTRHIGERVIFRSNPPPLVKGTVTAPDHPPVVLEGWHMAVRRRSTPAGSEVRGAADD